MNDKNRDLNQPNDRKVARLLQNIDNATEEERQIIAQEVQQELSHYRYHGTGFRVAYSI